MKVTRAKEHFDALYHQITEFNEANPYTVVVTDYPDTGDKLYRIGKPPHFPDTWGIDVGEIGYLLRSALDNLVFQLAREGGGQPEEDRTAFPISLDRDEYWTPKPRKVRGKRVNLSYRDHCLTGVADAWKEKVDDVQPYHRLKNAPLHELAILNELCNRDKHRTHHAVHLMVAVERQVISVESDWEDVGEIEIRKTGRQLNVQAQLTTSHRPGDQSAIRVYPNVGMNRTKVEMFAAFGNNRIAFQQIKRLISYTDALLDWFKPAFEPTVVTS